MSVARYRPQIRTANLDAVLSMPQTPILKPGDVGYEGEFHTDHEIYQTVKVVNTKNSYNG